MSFYGTQNSYVFQILLTNVLKICISEHCWNLDWKLYSNFLSLSLISLLLWYGTIWIKLNWIELNCWVKQQDYCTGVACLTCHNKMCSLILQNIYIFTSIRHWSTIDEIFHCDLWNVGLMAVWSCLILARNGTCIHGGSSGSGGKAGNPPSDDQHLNPWICLARKANTSKFSETMLEMSHSSEIYIYIYCLWTTALVDIPRVAW